ncbi:hypothetical protein HCN44_005976 [Aphidius gifuensis]|uniref:H/ACA ribonucleoprotein complex subunit n=1 Tax=Aphidius gifuensis TaxID=684658 RepID=A0A834Y3K2_APHGI|nr:hypothetical protein HCN44_005976 [Aphidius gifuensis]
MNQIRKSEKSQLKGEFDYLPPIEQLNISVEEVLCEPLGKVGWTVDQMVVVIPMTGKPTLDLDTILFLDRGKRVLGRIFDVFGQVTEPHYCVRFNTPNHIKESNVEANMSVYFVPNSEHTSLVFESELRKIKATDEIDPGEEPHFSDDEEEAAYRRSKKNSDVPAKRPRKSDWQSKHPWSSHNVSQRINNHQKSWLNQKQHPGYNNSYRNNHYGQYPCQFPPIPTFQELVDPSRQSFPWVNQVSLSTGQYSPWSWSSNPPLPPPPLPPSPLPAAPAEASSPPASS